MKKFFVLAATALALLACVQPEELVVNNEVDNPEGAVAFTVYAQKAAAVRGGGQVGDITNANIGSNGFGVFAYYTAGEKYDPNAKPNFMYNQQVTNDGTGWKYEPVKYWPNEYGNAAISDEIDYVTFFAYAPYTDIEPTTGEVKVTFPSDATDAQKAAITELTQKKNIISVNKNNATGDPIIKYVCDTDPATSVDLLWGVAANDAADQYSTINKTENPVKAGMPFLDLVKPGNPINDKIAFNLKHSLAKVKFTIDYVADEFTPKPLTTSAIIDSCDTRIFVRSFKISGWATKGALNLNNTTAGEPLWKDYDGVKDLAFNDIIFNDGRKDGKEGDVNGIQTNEENQGLNPNIVENWGDFTKSTDGFKGTGKNPGVLSTSQLLFGGDESQNGGYFYVIPRNEKKGAQVDVTIVYDVETIDPKLAGLLSDGVTHGLSTENVISKQDILGGHKDFEAGKQYLIKIHIGMTSVKIDAFVTEWQPTTDEDVDLPDNQPMPCWTIDGIPGYFTSDPTNGVTYDPEHIVKDSASFVAALADESGQFKQYYNYCDTATYEGVAFALAGSSRYNYNSGMFDDEYSNVHGYRSGTAWDALGFKRCYKGLRQDSTVQGATPYVQISVNPDILIEGAELYLVKGDNEILIEARPDFLIWGIGGTELPADNSDYTLPTTLKLKVKYPSTKIHYHETLY